MHFVDICVLLLQNSSEILKNHNYQRLNPQLHNALATYTSDKEMIIKAMNEINNSNQIKHQLEEMAQQLILIYKSRN